MNIPGIDLATGAGDMSLDTSATSGTGAVTSGDSRLSFDGSRIDGASLVFNQGSTGVMGSPAIIGLIALGVLVMWRRG